MSHARARAEQSQPAVSTSDERPALTLVRCPGPAEIDPARYQSRRRRRDTILGVTVPIIFLCLWQMVSKWEVIDPQLFPAPTDVFSEGVTIAESGELTRHIWISTQRSLMGFALGVAAGILVGVVMGSSTTIRAAFDPMLTALYTVPKLALLPIFLLLFGIGEFPKVLLIAIAIFFIVWVQTMGAFMSVPAEYIEAAESFGANRLELVRHVQWPASLPQIFVGLRIAIGVAILVMVGIEFVQASSGIGWMIWNSWSLFLPTRMYVGIVVVALMGVIGTWAVKLLSKALVPWASDTSGRTSASL